MVGETQNSHKLAHTLVTAWPGGEFTWLCRYLKGSVARPLTANEAIKGLFMAAVFSLEMGKCPPCTTKRKLNETQNPH